MSVGYVYCFSNPSMPDLLKVGFTERTPDERISDLYTTGVPTPFIIEFAKKVINPRHKEKFLHKLLDKYTERWCARREFFRSTPAIIRNFFELMDGEWWNEQDADSSNTDADTLNIDTLNIDTLKTDTLEAEVYASDSDNSVMSVSVNYLNNNDSIDDSTNMQNESNIKKKFADAVYKDIKKCFENGTQIRHTIRNSNNNIIIDTWIGKYNSIRKGIIYNRTTYKSINAFAQGHIDYINDDSIRSNILLDCEYKINDKWVPVMNIHLNNI